MVQSHPVCILSTGYTKQYYTKLFAMLVHLKVVSPTNTSYRKEKNCCSIPRQCTFIDVHCYVQDFILLLCLLETWTPLLLGKRSEEFTYQLFFQLHILYSFEWEDNIEE